TTSDRRRRPTGQTAPPPRIALRRNSRLCSDASDAGTGRQEHRKMRILKVLRSVMVISSIGAAVTGTAAVAPTGADPVALVPARPGIYAPVRLEADLSGLSAWEREALGLFIDAAVVMDDLFWAQAYPGDRKALLDGLKDPAARRF